MTDCNFNKLVITKGTIKTNYNYKKTLIDTRYNLTINDGITSIGGCKTINNFIVKNFTNTLTIPYGLTITNYVFTSCLFKNIVITKGTTETNGNYQALPIARGCNLTINDGITSISSKAFPNPNFTGTLSISFGLTIASNAFTGCAFKNLVISKGTITKSCNYDTISIDTSGNITIKEKSILCVGVGGCKTINNFIVKNFTETLHRPERKMRQYK